jgi:PAS domain-containing protein
MEGKPFHIELLHNEIQKRKLNNPRYSLRAFSRYLGLGPSTLSRILSHNQDLSLSATKKIIRKLKLSPDDRRLFISSVVEEKKQRALNSLASTGGPQDIEYLSSFEETLKSSRDMIFVLDRFCRCVHTNESASRLFNLPLNQMIGKTLEQLGVDLDLCREIKETAEIVWESAMLGEVVHRYDFFEGLTFEILLLPVMGEDEQVIALACHWRDITETVAMENQLRLLLEAGQILSHALDYKKALSEFAQLLSESFSDAVYLQLFADGGVEIQQGRRDLLESFPQIFPPDQKNNSQYSDLLKTGEPLTLSHLNEASFTFSHSHTPCLGSLLCLALHCREQSFGSLILLRTVEHEPFSTHDMEFSRDLSLRAAETIDYCLLLEKCQG